jgi:hydroxymethylbilane synthase
MGRRVIVGSRGSRLALIQTDSVVARIREMNPGLEVNIIKIATTGDRNHRSLPGVMDTAIFVKELEEALLDGRIDMAVHSLKDLPTELPPRLCLLAVTERLDPRDALVAHSQLNELAPGARIGTSSLRRTVQLMSYRPDLQAQPIRGNVDTRLRKVQSGEFDGVIVAAAALLRLGWAERITEYLPLSAFLPAVGQGALAIEARLSDADIAHLVAPINHLPTWQCVTAERALLRALEGGCRTPVASLATISGATLRLAGMVASTSGQRVLQAQEEGRATAAAAIGIKLAEKMQAMGSADIIAEARNSENR